MYATTDKVKVVFGNGNTRVLRIQEHRSHGIVLTKFAGTLIRVKRFMHVYVTNDVLTEQQQRVIFGGK